MRRIFRLLLFSFSLTFGVTLQEMYDNASSSGEFQKVIELEMDEVYTGGLVLEGENAKSLKIIGNGAIWDMNGEILSMIDTDKSFNIKDLVVLNGCFSFVGEHNQYFLPIPGGKRPNGIVEFVTFYEPIGYAVRMKCVGGDDITLKRNIIVGAKEISDRENTASGFSFGIDKEMTSYDGFVENWSYDPEHIFTGYEQGENADFVKLCNTG